MAYNKCTSRLYRNNNHEITLGGLLKQPIQEFILDVGLFDNPEEIHSEEDSDMSVEGSPENRGRINKDVQQTLKIKSIKIETKKIQNNHDIELAGKSVFCFVCKEIFLIGDTIIEIQCCSQKAIHTKCARVFKDKLHSCSICNKKLNEQVYKPHIIFQPVIENKV